MISKVYDKIKQILREYFKFFIFLFVMIGVLTFPFPYYINTPGGLINVSDRVHIDGASTSEGSLNMAYVTEMKATIPTLFFSLFFSDWDIYKEEEITYHDEDIEDTYFRDRLMLEETSNNAIIVGFTKASKQVEITDLSFIVSHIDKDAITDLKIGDVVLSIDGTSFSSRDELNLLIQSMDVGKRFSIQVTHDGEVYERYAEVRLDGKEKLIGILISSKKTVETIPKVELTFKKSESGPSGGLMTALAIYNDLTDVDITKGRKIVGTGTIDEEGNVGSIGGVKYKIMGAVKQKAELFLVPSGENYEEAIRVKEEKGYDIEIVGVATFDEALHYLMDLS